MKLYSIPTFCDPGETRQSEVKTYTDIHSQEWPRCKMYNVKAKSVAKAGKIAVGLRLETERSWRSLLEKQTVY